MQIKIVLRKTATSEENEEKIKDVKKKKTNRGDDELKISAEMNFIFSPSLCRSFLLFEHKKKYLKKGFKLYTQC